MRQKTTCFLLALSFALGLTASALAADRDLSRAYLENAYLSLERAENQLMMADKAGGSGMDCEQAFSDVRWVRTQIGLILHPQKPFPKRIESPSVDGRSLGRGVDNILENNAQGGPRK